MAARDVAARVAERMADVRRNQNIGPVQVVRCAAAPGVTGLPMMLGR